ncbi:acyltransferase family protein [Acinetobacter sp. WZC-1]|uniref:acyltransferase family protein n=1 Tax=Acinetobacter sp. WZC-1 TaxID=3459034 RepID=UPI00403E2E53
MRNYKIDVLRGLAILLVLIHHFNIPYTLQDTVLGIAVFGESLSTLIARNGNYGVTLFFVISGFLITQHTLQRSASLVQINIRDFYIRRIARIIPCLILLVVMVTLLGSLGLQPFVNHAPKGAEVSYGMTVWSALTFWMNLLIIKYGWVNYALGVLWSLSVEEVFYLAFPLLCVLLGRGRGLILLLVATIAYAPYFRFLHAGEDSEVWLYHYFVSFDGIAMGCLTALIRQKWQWHHGSNPCVLMPVVILMCALYLYAPIREVSTWGISAFALLSAVLIYGLADNRRIERPSRRVAGLVWVGQRSYEMYLFHLIILGIMKVFYAPKLILPGEKLLLFPIFLMTTFLLSWFIEKYYSTPLNLKIRTRLLQSTNSKW